MDVALRSRTSKHGLGRDNTDTAVGYGRLTLLLVDAKKMGGGLPNYDFYHLGKNIVNKNLAFRLGD